MTNSPQSIAEALARKCAIECAKQVGMFDMYFHAQRTEDVINNFIDLAINKYIPLVELLECVQELRIRDEIARCNRKSDCKELSKLNEKLRELKVI